MKLLPRRIHWTASWDPLHGRVRLQLAGVVLILTKPEALELADRLVDAAEGQP